MLLKEEQAKELKKGQLIHQFVAMAIDEILLDVIDVDRILQFVELFQPIVRTDHHLYATQQYVIGPHPRSGVTHSHGQLWPLEDLLVI